MIDKWEYAQEYLDTHNHDVVAEHITRLEVTYEVEPYKPSRSPQPDVSRPGCRTIYPWTCSTDTSHCWWNVPKRHRGQ